MIKKFCDESFKFPVIGIIHSCYKEKFGIPRQPGLVPSASGAIEIVAPYNNPAAFDGLDQCSHIWVQFVFHQSLQHEWRPKVRPPRLGGNKTLGVFATRSPVRPSPIGLSVVKLDSINLGNGVQLNISGGDFLDATPVLDIKPYVPYVDIVGEATNCIADAAPAMLPVRFTEEVIQLIVKTENPQLLQQLIKEVLQQDPRPRYQKTDSTRTYGMKLNCYDVRWRYLEYEHGDEIEVVALASAI
ncbi:tRNA (N6-threonylcarbamoyladenosine(37)-N6)-methyltransferase TrmO [Teredinibacter haidensis]|uniref:tRNA (N6-threonylcarbamoyladenosine(37)-N6)-methyltransferase TrmO n=1 Tax=Teredinibacter haidensis TaxID=2731755 RepID=UPI000949195A|nr:tRNA (N6-threonylcarbamoyladenosine(37)-N6)-methyltransferase TrmO [Teredinibacter haidensis]